MIKPFSRFVRPLCWLLLLLTSHFTHGELLTFNRQFAPLPGLVAPEEKPLSGETNVLTAPENRGRFGSDGDQRQRQLHGPAKVR